jgi:hypothetical protein
MKQKIRSSRPRRLNARISSFTQRERAALGEQITIWQTDLFRASLMDAPRSVALASSSRSRKIGASRFGTEPRAVARPTSCLGGR